jgi:hypothetical protein
MYLQWAVTIYEGTQLYSYKPVLWIRIRIGDANPDPGARKLSKINK